jgi:hypothetical protein
MPFGDKLASPEAGWQPPDGNWQKSKLQNLKSEIGNLKYQQGGKFEFVSAKAGMTANTSVSISWR